MQDLTFTIIDKPEGDPLAVKFVRLGTGVLRRATAEEVILWDALAEARRQLEERQPQRAKK